MQDLHDGHDVSSAKRSKGLGYTRRKSHQGPSIVINEATHSVEYKSNDVVEQLAVVQRAVASVMSEAENTSHDHTLRPPVACP